jgi:acetyltransferase-like isoleucine patch superfamily enzyme
MTIVATLLQRVRGVCIGLASRWRNVYFRLLGMRMNGYIWMRAVEIPRFHQCIELTRCSLDRGVVLLCNGTDPRNDRAIKISIGEGAYLNRGTFLDANESIVIGGHTAIGPGCYITDHDHGDDPTRPPLQQEMIAKPTRIGEWVWLGAHVVVLKGVTIGARTIVGAGSVVTKDLPPDVIAVGVPAKVIRARTADDQPAPSFDQPSASTAAATPAAVGGSH